MLCSSILTICITCLSAFAVTLIFKTSTTTNFAQGSIATLGCYLTAALFGKMGLPVYLGVFPGILLGILFGLFVDVVIFRHGRNVLPVGKQIITMGLVSIIFGGIPLIFGNPESIPFEPFYNAVAAGESPNIIIPFGQGLGFARQPLSGWSGPRPGGTARLSLGWALQADRGQAVLCLQGRHVNAGFVCS